MRSKLSATLIVPFVFLFSIFVFAQEHAKVRQPSLTPQNSGTTQGLIAVSPVNPRVVWASGRGGTFVVTTDGGQTWRGVSSRARRRCNFATSRVSARKSHT